MQNRDSQHPLLSQFRTKDGEPYPVPKEGSLGLLALGDIGLIAWRMVKQENPATFSHITTPSNHAGNEQ